MVKFHRLDRTFAALADPTRREILERLFHGPASISELAVRHSLSLPGVMKHVRMLEDVDLVRTEKRGRTRQCRLGPARLEEATRWVERYRKEWERRLDRLEAYIQKKEGPKR